MPDGAALISAYIFTVTAHAKKPVQTDGLLHLSDAWQFMAGVLPATLRAVAAQRVLTGRLQIKQKAQSFD
ncbi:hypothetical protein E1364_22100 [Salmonella enterica subsp. enterica serovar Falkensee]|nr:hypothetical protein [Salmonella enterica subsp. enterica serovar Falkensee]